MATAGKANVASGPENQQRRLRTAGAQREGEEDDRAEQQAANAEPGLGREVLPFQVRDIPATQMRRRG